MRSRSQSEWRDYKVTDRDLVADNSIVLMTECDGCRVSTEANIWKIGARLADDLAESQALAVLERSLIAPAQTTGSDT